MPPSLQSLDQVIETFSLFDDWEDRYRYLIDLGRNIPAFPEGKRTDETLVRGCTSKVWMVSEIRDGVFHFEAESDAHIVRGLIGLLVIIYQDRTVGEIAGIDIGDIFQKLGLEQNLSPNRRSGFYAMVDRIRAVTSRGA